MKSKILEKYTKNCKNAKLTCYSQVTQYLNSESDYDKDGQEMIFMNFPGNVPTNFNSRFGNDDMLPLTLSFNEFSKHIREINLMYNRLSDEGIVYISKVLQNCFSIFSLNLMGNSVSDNGCKELVSALKGKQSLYSLNLNTNQIGNIGAMHINELLYTNPELQILDLGYNLYDWDGIISITTTLTTTNHNLNILNLDDPRYKIADQFFFTHFGKMFLLNKGLVKISMKFHKIRFEGIKIMTHYLKENNVLKILDISGNQIDFLGFKYLQEYLEVTETLECLIISGNKACDSGAKYFAQGISKNRSLVHVDLTNNDLHNDGLCRLAEGLRTNDTLKSLRVFWSNFFEEESIKMYKELLDFKDQESQNFYPDFVIYKDDNFDLSIAHYEPELPEEVQKYLI